MNIADKYVKASVLGASDGIVTTFAVVAGVVGAGFATEIIIVLGIANMVADGISMALGDFLGERSVEKMHKKNGTESSFSLSSSGVTGIVTFISFIVAGTLPLLPYVALFFGLEVVESMKFSLSVTATLSAMFVVGSMRTIVTGGVWWKNGLEMLFVGSIAATAAYTLGSIVEQSVG